MRVAFRETLSGGVHAPGQPAIVQPFTLELEARARGVVESALGSPMAVEGRLRADPAPQTDRALLPASALVEGTLRFLVSAGLFYDLQLLERAGAPPRDRLTLRGARRFVRGDLFTSATTFEGELSAHGEPAGVVRLRFDARDDIPRFFRSLRRW